MLHEIFEKMVYLYPNRIAIQFENENFLTYQELDHLSNQLAHYFLEEGVYPRQPIFLYLPRSLWQVTVFLALLKLGAIPIPVSSEQLQSRIQKIYEDCAPTHIITTAVLHNSLNFVIKHSTKLIFLDKATEYKEKSKNKPEIRGLTEDDIAYIAFSSGTTGLPKGIPIKHAGITHYWTKELPIHIQHPVLKVAANASLDFDVHIWEYFMAWLFGATLHIASEDTRKDIDRLVAFVIKHNISDITLTPTILRALTDKHLVAIRLAGLKAIYSTGEACTVDIIARYSKYSINVFNCYGPTEATFGLSMTICPLKNFYKGMAPIGIPSVDSGIQIKIIDDLGKEIKKGEAGELVIISPFITPGYLNREKDSEKFIKYKGDKGLITSYRTGDKFIFHNHQLYYVGRINSLTPVKIHGQFVNIEGIEQILRQFKPKKIKDAYVIVKYDLDRKPILVAFIISELSPTLEELRKYCTQLLSSSSIPSFFVNITYDELPLTINGKIDREALSKKDFFFKRDSSLPYIPARNLLEFELTKLWEKLLCVTSRLKISIGIKDYFAMLGGDSIKAMVLIEQIKSKFNINLLPSKLGSLEELTIEKLSNYINKELNHNNIEEGIELLKKGNKNIPPLFLLPPISGESTFTYQKLCHFLKTAGEVFVLNAPNLTEPLSMGGSIQEMAQFYLSLIRKIQPKGGVNIIGWSSGGILAYEIAYYLETKDEVVDFLGIIDEISPQLQHAMTNEGHANELIDLVNFFQEKYSFKLYFDRDDLLKLPKKEQILKIFKDIPRDLPIAKNLEHVKFFMLNFLNYKPNNLKKTTITIFRTEATGHKVVSLTAVHGERISLGWSQYSSLYPTICELKGDHFSIMLFPEELAMKIDSCIHSIHFKEKNRFKKKFSATSSMIWSNEVKKLKAGESPMLHSLIPSNL